MELPNPIKVRIDFSRTIEDLDSFITFLSTRESVSHSEFLYYLHPINMATLQVWHQISLLTVTDKKYSKAFERLRKILVKLLVDSHGIEKKHVKNILFWKHKFQEGKLRKDLIKFFKNVSKQMKEIQKII